MRDGNSVTDRKIMLVDDEVAVLQTSALALKSAGFKNVDLLVGGRELMSRLEKGDVALVLLDVMMPGLSGKELLGQIVASHPEVPVIMMTALNDVDTVVECMRTGAFDYLDKPVENLRLTSSVRRALDYGDLQRESSLLKQGLLSPDLAYPEVFDHILTCSEKMLSIFRYIEAIAPTSRAVLITGETGTGKELIAKAVHDASGKVGNYVDVNVAGLDDNLFADTLFGHMKGAFTGADRNRQGLVEQAEGGTLFLDEIGDLSIPSQVKLLRLLQEKEYYPLGSDRKKSTTARIVVATSQELRSKLQDGSFRRDLYFRLLAHQIDIPPLRQRRGDILLLFQHFLESACASMQREAPELHDELLPWLQTYAFPGNIREMEAMIFNALSMHRAGTLSRDDFRDYLKFSIEKDTSPASTDSLQTSASGILFPEPLPTIDEAVDALIDAAMKYHENNQSATARTLGITRQGLISRLKRRQLTPD